MSRFARERRVFFVEEPVFDATSASFEKRVCPRTQVNVLTPHLPSGIEVNDTLRRLLAEFAAEAGVARPIAWFYTPMALDFFPQSLAPRLVVYDCMDELSLFHGASARIQILEQELLRQAGLVFTGGVSLFESKRRLHANVHPFPSGVDVMHFLPARRLEGEYAEQAGMARPRLGYAGVIDERLDLALVREVAERRPGWQIVMIGPTVKISPDSVPRRANIHWLGMKDYSELPKYFAGWDVGIMPFALNDATRFISPTKTPEYLSAGLPVVSTAIRDVERPYGESGLAKIAHSPEEFVRYAEAVMAEGRSPAALARADEFLRHISWDSVWGGMNRLIGQSLAAPEVQPIAQGTGAHV